MYQEVSSNKSINTEEKVNYDDSFYPPLSMKSEDSGDFNNSEVPSFKERSDYGLTRTYSKLTLMSGISRRSSFRGGLVSNVVVMIVIVIDIVVMYGLMIS